MSATGRNFRNFKPIEELVPGSTIHDCMRVNNASVAMQVGVDSGRRGETKSVVHATVFEYGSPATGTHPAGVYRSARPIRRSGNESAGDLIHPPRINGFDLSMSLCEDGSLIL